MRSLALIVLLAACGDGADATVDALPVDGMPNPIVGRWQRSPYNGEAPPNVEFAADGVYRYDDDVGTWTIASDGELVTDRGQYPREKAPYYLSEDRTTLMTMAFRPTAPTNGLVGTWSGSYTYENNERLESMHEFRADNTVSWTDTFSVMGMRRGEGTWQLVGDSVNIAATINGTTQVNIGMKLVPGVALGDGLLRRVD